LLELPVLIPLFFHSLFLRIGQAAHERVVVSEALVAHAREPPGSDGAAKSRQGTPGVIPRVARAWCVPGRRRDPPEPPRDPWRNP
jgi:hypothetical protein